MLWIGDHIVQFIQPNPSYLLKDLETDASNLYIRVSLIHNMAWKFAKMQIKLFMVEA